MAEIKELLGRVSPSIRASEPYGAETPQCRIKLDGNESPFDLTPEARAEMLEFFSQIETNRYPDPDCAELRKLVSKQTGTPPGGILFGNGSDELIQILIETFCGKSGNVLVPSPTFSMYGITANALGKNVVEENLDGDFDLDTPAMLSAIRSHDPDAVFLASPNSPTGNLLSPSRVEEVIEASPGIVVVDEAYFSFCGRSVISLMDKYENLAVLRTFSKTGFAAIRLGVLFMRPELAAQAEKARLPYNINSFTQAAARIFFTKNAIFEDNIKAVVSGREKLCASLASIDGIKVFPSDANFFLIRFPDSASAKRARAGLLEKGILVRGFSGGRVADCLRVTAGLAEENREFEAALRSVLSRVP
ncbi:MAG: histidinol-phosphate transaminase [Thermodesulfobacteriota bacterium]